MAMAGLLRYFGGSAAPQVAWLPIADIGGGATMAVAGILAAIVARATTGEGDYLDLSMAEGALYWQQTRAQWYLATGEDPVADALPVTGGLPGYGVYQTADDDWLSLGCMEPVFWKRLCALLGMPDAVDSQHDPDAFEALDGRLRAALRARGRDEWFQVMREREIPAAPCNTIAEALEDEHFIARGRIGGPDAHDRIRSPFHFTDIPRQPTSPAPRLGADTDAVLAEFGIASDRIAALREAGVVR